MNLSPEALSGITNMLGAGDEPAPELVAAPVAEDTQVQADTSSDTTEDVNVNVEDGADSAPLEAAAEDSPAAEEDVPSGHRVPYDRNQFREERAGLEAEIERLRSQPATAPAPVQAAPQADSDDAWLERYLAGDDEPAPAQDNAKLNEFQERLYNTEVQLARQQLEVEVGGALQKFLVGSGCRREGHLGLSRQEPVQHPCRCSGRIGAAKSCSAPPYRWRERRCFCF